MAMGFRADKVPAGFLVPKSNATRALLNRPVPLTNTADWDPDSLSRWQQSSTKNTCRDFWVPAASMLTWAQQQQQHLGGSVVLWPPEGGVESGSLQWSSTATSRQVTSNLKGKTTSGLLRECGPCGSRVYVYIYNCFTSPDALLLVKVNLTQHSTDYYDQCYTTRDKTVAFTQGFSVFCMVLCAVAFFLPLSISVYAAARRAWDRRRAKNRCVRLWLLLLRRG
jgi:hypothetical protein